MSQDRSDIIVPVLTSLDSVSACLDSILNHTRYPYNLIIIDRGSDPYVSSRLNEYKNKHPHINIRHHKPDPGLTKNMASGIVAGNGEYLAMLNSDTIVTPGWLSRLVACVQSDAQIALVSPVCNSVGEGCVPMPPGLNIFTLAEKIAQVSKKVYPDIIGHLGHCFLVKRKAIDKLKRAEAISSSGSFSVLNLCQQTRELGARAVIADDAYVFTLAHSDNGEQRRSQAAPKASLDNGPLGYLNAALLKDIKEDPKHDLAPLISLWIMAKDTWKLGGMKALLNKSPVMPIRLRQAIAKVAKSTKPKASPSPPLASQNVCVNGRYVKRLPKGKGIRVAILVYSFDLSGGLVSLLQLVNEIIANGHTAYLVTLSEKPEPEKFRLYTRPMRFKTEEEMARYFPEVDLVEATFWPTAFWIPEIKKSHPDIKATYSIRDFESWFYPESDTATRQKVLGSYGLVDCRIVTSGWLQAKLAALGYAAHKICCAVNLDLFYPRDARKDSSKKRILFQARPFEPRRGFANGLKVFESIASRRPDVEFVFFGCRDNDLRRFSIPFNYINEGIIYDQNALAKLYSSCQLLLDPSLFQAFSRPGIEAMACGIPTILTKAGGSPEYARDQVNTIAVDPHDISGIAEAVMMILEDFRLRDKLIENGLQTAKEFSHKQQAKRYLELYKSLVSFG